MDLSFNKSSGNIAAHDDRLEAIMDECHSLACEDCDGLDEMEVDGNNPMKGINLSQKDKARHALTGRGVTLGMLMTDGIVEPGDGLMSIDYLGQHFTADLLPDGRIRWQEENRLFGSPSAWAIHCKKIVNPMKKSGCGWASVRYKGKKLDSYKSAWFRKQKALLSESNEAEENKSDIQDSTDESFLSVKMKEEPKPRQTEVHNLQIPQKPQILQNTPNPKQSQLPRTPQTPQTPQSSKTPVQNPLVVKPERKVSVKHSTLRKKTSHHDPNTMVECVSFASLGKIQPFTVSISTNCRLLIDFHCHLTTSEVTGYIAGKWDPQTQHLSVQQAFPCRCRLGDKENAANVENLIRQNMDRRGLSLVGWYHSHPKHQPDPSLRDIEAQMEYQLVMKGAGNTYHPCLGLIVSPYDVDYVKTSSVLRAFWVTPPPEHRPLDYGMPLYMRYSTLQDMFIGQDLYSEMSWLVEFYKGEIDFINFTDSWHTGSSYLAKLKASLATKFAKDQPDERLLEFVHNLLASK